MWVMKDDARYEGDEVNEGGFLLVIVALIFVS